jgi:hypothetical protein
VVYYGNFGKRVLVSILEFDTQRDDDFGCGYGGKAILPTPKDGKGETL